MSRTHLYPSTIRTGNTASHPSRIRRPKTRVSRIRRSEIRVSKTRVSETRVSKTRVSETRVSKMSFRDEVFFPSTPPSRRSLGFVTEVVRLDRRTVEKMSNGGYGGSGEYLGEGSAFLNVDRFLRDLMTGTDTQIMVESPRRGKDLQVVIQGEAAKVKEVRDKINSTFNYRQDRVTLKLDVSFDAHSHIIGRGGRSIQRVMDSTSTHVHFPDSNRTSTFEKSNQVSIAGTAAGAEKARCQVRELMPLTINYEIPLNSFVRRAMDTSSAFYQMLQRNFAISVSIQPVRVSGDFFDFGEPSVIKLSIRGTKGTSDLMRQGTAFLLEQVTNGTYNLSSTPATCDIEIAVQNHVLVMGRNECNVRELMHSTNAIIAFPEQSAAPFIGPAASSLPNRKSTVSIKGPNFDSVFKAWDGLQGYLPLILIFDLNEGQDADPNVVARLMERLKVSIQVKPKVRQNLNSVIVKGIEKDSRVLFEVRRELLNLDQSEVPYCCSGHFFKKFSETYEIKKFSETYERSLVDHRSPPIPANPPSTRSDALPSRPSSSLIDLEMNGIWGPPEPPHFYQHLPTLSDSYPTWLPHSCLPDASRKTRQHDFLTSDRPSVLESANGHDSLTTLLTKAGLGQFAPQFEDMSLDQFIRSTPENLMNFPYQAQNQLSTLISQLKWAYDNKRSSTGSFSHQLNLCNNNN